ncbi:MAG TPA: hypothetical protein VKQ30_00115 [Ktedonobacterales bacterium]|nr:hypothetical protein [Ktedonobacterales bacterium]
MRIRLGFADGVQDIVIGELESTPEGIQRYGKHKLWLRNIILDARRIPAAEAGGYAHIGVSAADFTPDRLEGQANLWLRLTDEQVLREILDSYRRSTYYWAEEVPS